MNEISWNAHDQSTLWHSDSRLNWQVYLCYVCCTSKLDLYILDAPVSKRLIIEQGVSEYLNISTVVEHKIPFTSLQTRYFRPTFYKDQAEFETCSSDHLRFCHLSFIFFLLYFLLNWKICMAEPSNYWVTVPQIFTPRR